MDGPHILLTLQQHDTEADQLNHRRAHMPERTRLDQVTAEMAAVEREGVDVTAQRDQLVGRQGDLERELGEIERRLDDLDRRMLSGTVTASRDLQAMMDQVESLKRRRSDLEDSDLEVMEALDPVDALLGSLQGRWASLETEAIALRAAIAEAEVAIDAQLAQVMAARSEAAGAVAADLLATYERLRRRLGGVGAAPLVGSSCGGCHLTLSASELDGIRRLPADAVVTCEQCGRILVR